MDQRLEDFSSDVDLAAATFGGAVIYANDDFFAPKENLLKPTKPVFLEHEYTDRGKWMDGWESRRRRTPGHDYCLVRLGLPGKVRALVVDTSFFRGNYPEHCSVEACSLRSDASVEDVLRDGVEWTELLPKSPLKGDSSNIFQIASATRVTHLRFNIFPDGGVARLRVHGEPVPDWRALARAGREIDLAAVENGGKVVSCSDMFFGNRHNLIVPWRAANMGDGWETKRRRGPGYDWALLELSAEGVLSRLEVDTNHFKGNYPDACMIEGADESGVFREVLPRTKLQASTRHVFEEELVDRGPFRRLRLNIYPDGGVSRLRVYGEVTRRGAAEKRIARLDALPIGEAARELLACCGSHRWAERVASHRPFVTDDMLHARADEAFAEMSDADWLEAFSAHPKIGEKKAASDTGGAARAWSEGEQSSVKLEDDASRKLAALNRAYQEKFGFIFIVCATGLGAGEVLARLEGRIGRSRDEELAAAREEQKKITHLRIDKMLKQ